jgi:hypothetical protein
MAQAWFTLLVGFVAASIAVWGILTQRAIARRRATFDHISKTEADADFIQARRTFIELAKQKDGLSPWSSEDCEKTAEVQAIKLILNDFELIAIGVQRGIIDFEFYKRWHRSGVLRHWAYAKPFVEGLRRRTSNSALFHEFEQLAAWMDEKHQRRLSFWDRFF